MAVLTPTEKDEIRQAFAKPLEFNGGVVWSKSALNAAIQAVEDVLTGAQAQTAISNAIDAAIAPATMTNAQKRALAKMAYVSLGRRFS